MVPGGRGDLQPVRPPTPQLRAHPTEGTLQPQVPGLAHKGAGLPQVPQVRGRGGIPAAHHRTLLSHAMV